LNLSRVPKKIARFSWDGLASGRIRTDDRRFTKPLLYP
jgi:hypothetical protein